MASIPNTNTGPFFPKQFGLVAMCLARMPGQLGKSRHEHSPNLAQNGPKNNTYSSTREREEARKRDEALNKELMGEFGSGGRTAADKKNRMKKKMDEDASDSEDDEERKQREGKEREKLAEVRALRGEHTGVY